MAFSFSRSPFSSEMVDQKTLGPTKTRMSTHGEYIFWYVAHYIGLTMQLVCTALRKRLPRCGHENYIKRRSRTLQCSRVDPGPHIGAAQGASSVLMWSPRRLKIGVGWGVHMSGERTCFHTLLHESCCLQTSITCQSSL